VDETVATPARPRTRRPSKVVATKRATVPPPAKQPRKCRNCREPGHRADKCPNASADEDEEEGRDVSPPSPPPPARPIEPLDDAAREERRLALREAVADREARREQLRRERDKRSASYVRRHGRPRKGEERVVIDPDAVEDDDEPRGVTDDVLQQVPVLKTYVL
jgi:hypothetical protein